MARQQTTQTAPGHRHRRCLRASKKAGRLRPESLHCQDSHCHPHPRARTHPQSVCNRSRPRSPRECCPRADAAAVRARRLRSRAARHRPLHRLHDCLLRNRLLRRMNERRARRSAPQARAAERARLRARGSSAPSAASARPACAPAPARLPAVSAALAALAAAAEALRAMPKAEQRPVASELWRPAPRPLCRPALLRRSRQGLMRRLRRPALQRRGS